MLSVANELGYTKLDHAKKNPSVVAEVMRRAAAQGARSASLELIVQNAYKMRRPTVAMEIKVEPRNAAATSTGSPVNGVAAAR